MKITEDELDVDLEAVWETYCDGLGLEPGEHPEAFVRFSLHVHAWMCRRSLSYLQGNLPSQLEPPGAVDL